MIRNRRNSIIFLLCFQAMAVAIICFGSLINFHQYKIWGKPLIPNFIGYKRDVDHISKTLSFSKLTKDNQQIQKDFSGEACDFGIEVNQPQFGPCSVISCDLSNDLPVSRRVSPSGLRGPPIS